MGRGAAGLGSVVGGASSLGHGAGGGAGGEGGLVWFLGWEGPVCGF